MESTFQEVRQRLGFETQRQWSELAIRRSAPALLGLFSLVTLFAHQHMTKGAHSARQTAWYRKPHPYLLRRSGASAQAVVGARTGDFSRVSAGGRRSKSPAGVYGTADRRGLLCGVMAKVQVSENSQYRPLYLLCLGPFAGH